MTWATFGQGDKFVQHGEFYYPDFFRQSALKSDNAAFLKGMKLSFAGEWSELKDNHGFSIEKNTFQYFKCLNGVDTTFYTHTNFGNSRSTYTISTKKSLEERTYLYNSNGDLLRETYLLKRKDSTGWKEVMDYNYAYKYKTINDSTRKVVQYTGDAPTELRLLYYNSQGKIKREDYRRFSTKKRFKHIKYDYNTKGQLTKRSVITGKKINSIVLEYEGDLIHQVHMEKDLIRLKTIKIVYNQTKDHIYSLITMTYPDQDVYIYDVKH